MAWYLFHGYAVRDRIDLTQFSDTPPCIPDPAMLLPSTAELASVQEELTILIARYEMFTHKVCKQYYFTVYLWHTWIVSRTKHIQSQHLFQAGIPHTDGNEIRNSEYYCYSIYEMWFVLLLLSTHMRVPAHDEYFCTHFRLQITHY